MRKRRGIHFLVVSAAFLACQYRAARPIEARDAPEPAQWDWTYQPDVTHVAVLFFDHHGRRLLRAFTLAGGVPPCHSPSPSDSAFLERGTAFLKGVGWDFLYPGQQRAARVLNEFVSVGAHAGDFAAQVLFHEQGGLVFAASSVWSGTGSVYYPADALDSGALRMQDDLAPEPAAFVTTAPQPHILLETVRRLNVVHDLATQPYRVALFPYSREMQGGYDVMWIVLLVRSGRCP
jgi:hypothetical protein